MKKLLLVPLLALVASLCFAQTQTLPQKLQHFYAPLDKSQVSSGYLFDMSWSFAHPLGYRGDMNDSNFVNADIFGMLYGAMRAACVTATPSLPTAKDFAAKVKSAKHCDTIPLLSAVRGSSDPAHSAANPSFDGIIRCRPTTA